MYIYPQIIILILGYKWQCIINENKKIQKGTYSNTECTDVLSVDIHRDFEVYHWTYCYIT